MPSVPRARSRARRLTRVSRSVLVFALLCAAAAPAASAQTLSASLTRLSGDSGCFKGTTLLWMPCAPLAAGQFDASSVAVSPDGKFAYVASPSRDGD